MNRHLRSAFIVWIALLPALTSSGQVKFTTVVNSQELGQRDYLQVQFIVENAQQIDEFDPPNDFPGFHIVEGPIQSSGMSVINGNMSQYKGLSFVLQPTHTGKFTLAGASAVVDGKKMRSNNVVVTVRPGGSGAAPSGSGPFGGLPGVQPFGPDPFEPSAPEAVNREEVLRPGENVKEKINRNLFVKVQVDRNTCYVGEPIVATYKLYSRVNAESRVTKSPSLNGFSVYDMVQPGTDAVSVEKLNGKAFTVHTIRKAQLIPLQAGSIDLDPVEVENVVHFVKAGARQEPHRSGDRLRDLLDQLNGDVNLGPAVDENVTLDTKPLTITVKPLPEENKPVGFNGAVGNFTIEASLGNKTVVAQDEATLHVVVKGKGNLPVVTAPAVEWPAGIDAFDPTAKEEVNKSVVPMSGAKSFDYMFTARDSGDYLIPPINLSYFDPIAQKYKTVNTEPLDLRVTPAVKRARPASPAAASAASQEGDRFGGFVKGLLEMILAVLFGLGVLWLWWRMNRKKKDAVPVEPLVQERPEVAAAATTVTTTLPTTAYIPAAPAPDPLAEAREFFDNGDYKAFYREINRALWKSIGRKIDLPSSELNKHNVIAQLELRGWDGPSILSLESVLNECEMNLYTPAYDTYNMQQLLRQAEWVMSRLG
ncbi:MAG TPA: BatD family protein [Puia sp.]|nr:BatD family protein [Puia sp.]